MKGCPERLLHYRSSVLGMFLEECCAALVLPSYMQVVWNLVVCGGGSGPAHPEVFIDR